MEDTPFNVPINLSFTLIEIYFISDILIYFLGYIKDYQREIHHPLIFTIFTITSNILMHEI